MLGLVDPSYGLDFVVSDGPLDFLGLIATSPSVTTTSSLLNDSVSILNVDHVHSFGSYALPPSSINFGKPSFRDIVQYSSNSLMVQEAPTITIPLVK